ncbi:MAG: RraA family protein [Amphritea sp.]
MINSMAEPIPDEFIRRFEDMPSSIVSDCLGRNIGALGLKPYHGFKHMCGTALTVRVRPGDNLMILKALQMARPKDVLVVDGGGDTSRAVIGGLMRAMAIKANVSGVVVNGALRDRDEWVEGGLPVYALACVHRGPSSDGSGEINVPISCAGLVVNPGDLIIGDADGVVAVSPSELQDLYKRCQVLLDRENQILRDIEQGSLSKTRFDETLREKGCPIKP